VRRLDSAVAAPRLTHQAIHKTMADTSFVGWGDDRSFAISIEARESLPEKHT
jgi:hypothetical protein